MKMYEKWLLAWQRVCVLSLLIRTLGKREYILFNKDNISFYISSCHDTCSALKRARNWGECARRLLIRHACVWWPNYMANGKGVTWNRNKKKKRVAPAGNWKEMPKMHIQTECQAKLNNNYKVQANWESQQQRWPIPPPSLPPPPPHGRRSNQANCNLLFAQPISVSRSQRSRKQIIFYSPNGFAFLYFTRKRERESLKVRGGREKGR